MDNLGLHVDYVSMKHQTENNSSFNGFDTSKNLRTDAAGIELGVSALFYASHQPPFKEKPSTWEGHRKLGGTSYKL